jgi:uncharacterized repeat protein (TIGR01451 family)
VPGVGRYLSLAGLVLLAALALCAPAAAQIAGDPSSTRLVTLVARECDDYDDIRANLARNNIQESLQDLGADTLYVSGEPVNPVKELAGQPTCRPITGWRFTLGDGIAGSSVDGVWGKLSVVTDPDSPDFTTAATVPARDWQGDPVGNATIAGAVTVGLTDAQIERSDNYSLWLQGGTVADPVLWTDPSFAGRYGFGALRCSIDDLNGDNVETIQYPSGTRHAYCYAYYVTPPPSSGTIVIRKEVEGSEAAENFSFTGNVSYNPGGVFDLSAGDGNPGSIEFVRAETRAGDAPWTVVEDAHEGWQLTGLSCTSESGSTTITDQAARSVSITLVAGDTVTCTYTNRLVPPAGALVLRKVTRGGAGSFPFRVRDADGDVVARRTLTTRSSGGVGAFSVMTLDPGRYTISERRPASGEGVWRLSGVRCNGRTRDPGEPVEVTIQAGRGAVCTFTNRLDRPGRIIVRAVTIGGLDRGGYIVTPFDGGYQRRQFATTQRQGMPATARGQSTSRLAFNRYVIQQTATYAGEEGVWSLIAVSCNNRLVPFEQGRVIVRVSRRAPVQRCTFINLRQRDPDPPDPTPPPTPEPPDPVPGEDPPDLAITKEQVDSTGGPIPTLTFRLRVTNNAAVTAERVVVADRLAAGTVLVSANPSQGRCFMRGTRLLVCPLGELEPGASATIRVRVQQVDPQAGLNVAVVGGGSPEDILRNNVAGARVSAIQRPPSACPSRAIARTAC